MILVFVSVANKFANQKRASVSGPPSRMQSISDGSPLALDAISYLSASEALQVYMRTRRSKMNLNFNLEDFSRIHTQFADKTKQMYIETPIFSLRENEKIKFQLRLYPSKHSLSFDVVYRGTDSSAQVLVDAYLLDKESRRFAFEFGRRVESSINASNPESISNFLYDRDDLEKKRDKLFNADKLAIGLEVNATFQVEFGHFS